MSLSVDRENELPPIWTAKNPTEQATESKLGQRVFLYRLRMSFNQANSNA